MLQPFRAAMLCLVAAAACSSGGDGGTGPSPTIALSLGTSSATVTQGGNAPVVATLARGGGFGGTVALTVEGAPTGVTGSVGTPVTSFNSIGIASQQSPTDFHAMQVMSTRGTTQDFIDRSATLSFHLIGPKTVPLPPVPPVPTAITTATWNRIKASFTRPPEYDGSVTLSYSDDSFLGRAVNVTVSPGYLATQGSATFVEAPQLMDVSGFDNNWLPIPSSVPFTIRYTGGTTTGACSEGARSVAGARAGHVGIN